jgi:hypothetical protein
MHELIPLFLHVLALCYDQRSILLLLQRQREGGPQHESPKTAISMEYVHKGCQWETLARILTYQP